MLPLTLALCLTVNAPGAEPSGIEIDFSAATGKFAHRLHFGILIYAADGTVYWQKFGILAEGHFVEPAEDFYFEVIEAGIKAELSADKKTLRIIGWPDKSGLPRDVVCARILVNGLRADQLPKIKLPPPPPVVFDLAPVPLQFGGGPVRIDFAVEPAEGGESVRVTAEYVKLAKRADFAATVAEQFTKVGLKAEAAGDKVRVIGWADKDGKVRPAAAGKATSKDLVPGDLPRATGLPPALPHVVLDLAAFPEKPARATTFTLDLTTILTEDGPNKPERFRESFTVEPADTRADVAGRVFAKLIEAGYHAERDGERVKVYGWVSNRGKYYGKPYQVAAGRVESDALKAGPLPLVRSSHPSFVVPTVAPPPRPKE